MLGVVVDVCTRGGGAVNVEGGVGVSLEVACAACAGENSAIVASSGSAGLISGIGRGTL